MKHIANLQFAACATPHWTVARAIRAVEGWDDLSEKRRGQLISGLRVLCRLYDLPAESILLVPEDLTRRFDTCSPATLRIKPASLSVYRGQIRTVLRRLGIIDDRRRSRVPLSAAWETLRESLPDQFLSIRLQHFMQWCSDRAVEPEAVSDQSVMDYRRDGERNRIKGDMGDHARRVAKAWNRASVIVECWPATRLGVPSTVERYGLPLSDFPPSFEAEVDGMFARWAGQIEGGLYSRESDVGPLRLPTIASHKRTLRVILGGLIQSGVRPEEIRSLADLVARPMVERALDWHWRRAGGRKTVHTGHMAALLAMIARYEVRLTGRELDAVLASARRAKPKKQKNMTMKGEARLAQFDDPVKFATTMHFPQYLMDLAAEQKAAGDERQAAWTASLGVAVMIELHCPLRISSLNAIRIGHELVGLGSTRQRFTHLLIGEDKTKTSVPIRWALNQRTSEMIDIFIREYRPAVKGSSGPYLFVAREHTDRPRDTSAFGTAISEAFRHHLGIELNPHLFRAFAGKLILTHNPHAIEDLRQILGHTTFDTALRYYRSSEKQHATGRYDRTVTADWLKTRTAAKAAFSRLKSKPRVTGKRPQTPKKPKAPGKRTPK